MGGQDSGYGEELGYRGGFAGERGLEFGAQAGPDGGHQFPGQGHQGLDYLAGYEQEDKVNGGPARHYDGGDDREGEKLVADRVQPLTRGRR